MRALVPDPQLIMTADSTGHGKIEGYLAGVRKGGMKGELDE